VTEQTIEPGIARITDSRGRSVGYTVAGFTRAFRTLLAARRALRRVRRMK
jgi:hypothetical protein